MNVDDHDGVDDHGDQESFFQCVSDEDDGGRDDFRASFVTAVGDEAEDDDDGGEEEEEEDTSRYDYGMWMAADEPMYSIKERRCRLLQGMGLNSKSTRLSRLPTGGRRQQLAGRPSAMAALVVAAASLDIANATLPRCRSVDSRLASRGRAASLRRVCSVPRSLRFSPVHLLRQAPAAASSSNGGDVNRNSDDDDSRRRHGCSKDLNDGGKGDGRPRGGAGQRKADELEQFAGYTPLVKQMMRRSQSQQAPDAKPAKKKARWLKNIKLVATVAGLIHEKDGGIARLPSKSSAASAMNASMTSTTSTERPLKVHHSGTSSKELTGLYLRQELRAHEGSIWTLKFNADGRLLASGGEDKTVRVWEVVEGHPSWSELEKKGKNNVVVPEKVFEVAEKPVCVLEGHSDDVLDMSWSSEKNGRLLLTSSMDKTVRLWDTARKTCLKVFAHSDYVTCIQFNPADDGYFISGSLDCKVRIWSVHRRQVVDWTDLNDMVTAACYTPDGQAAIVGSHKGCCRFYKTRDCKLNLQEAQIDMTISKKRKSHAKKITGFQFAPENPSEILVTSADSKIRVFNGITVLQKFKGFKNTSSQISASYTSDCRYVVCASEDSHVYVWRRAGVGGGSGIGVKAKTWLTSRSYECFFCRDVSVAVPWPRSPSFRCAAADLDAPTCRRHGAAGRDNKSGPSIYGELLSSSRRCKSGPITYPGGQVDLLSRGAASRPAAEGGNAWGMVVVTASLGGEIRVYQNFGLPVGIRG